MKSFLLFLTAAFSCIGGTVNPNPEVLIPFADKTPGKNPAKWKKAAKLRIFTSDRASKNTQIPEATSLYLSHDNKNLYAGWFCADKKGNGIANALKPTDNLKLNESVQIVIGLTNGTPKQTSLKMGGYKGAFSTRLNIKHYYEFSANAVGAISRTYNETPLSRPLFKAEVFKSTKAGNYTVIMKIPLKSFGGEGKKVLFFNAFRFYRTIRYGWYLPSFGGYASMPFGRAILAAPSIKKGFTIEKIPGFKKRTSTPHLKAALKNVKTTYYPISRKLCAVFPKDLKFSKAYLQFANNRKSRKLSLDKKTIITIQVPELPAGKVQKAEIGIGKDKKYFQFTPWEKPEWMKKKYGIEYTKGKVPFPWTPPVMKDNEVKLKHADITFKNSLLPAQIKVKNKYLLSSPIKLEYKFRDSSKKLASGAPQKVKSTPDRIDIRSNNGQIEMRNVIDYDGFMVTRLRFPKKNCQELEKLTLIIPLKKGVAKFVNHGHAQEVITLDDFAYNSNAKDIWTGNANIGISFSSDRKIWFSKADGRQIVLKKRKDGGMNLKLRLVTAAGQVKDRKKVFQFFLLPTPSRAKMPPPMKNQMTLWFENWSDYQGYPDLKKLPEAHRRVEKAKKENKLLYMYFSQVLATNAPGAEKYGKEWFAPPYRPWYKRAYNPGKNVPCAVSCFRGAFGELVLNGVAKLIKEGLYGVYLDGPTFPFECQNPSHKCADSLPVIFDDDVQTGRVIGQRQFIKRLRGLFDQVKHRYPLWAHTGGGLNFPTLSLCDFYFDGEQLARFPRKTMIPQNTFMVAYSGQPFGYRGIFLPQTFSDASGNTPALPWSIIHGIESSGPEAAQDKFFTLPRQDKTAKFYPYYNPQPHIKLLNQTDVAISYYLGKQKAILAASNLHYNGTQEVELDVSGLLDKFANVNEISSDEKPILKNGIMRFKLPEGKIRLFAFTTQVNPNKPPALRSKDKAPKVILDSKAKWLIKSSYPPANTQTDKKWPVAVFSKVAYPQAQAILLNKLPSEFNATIKLKHENRFRICLNNFYLRLDSGRWKLSGTNVLDYRGNCRVYGGIHKAPNKEITIKIGVKNGLLTLVYDKHLLLDKVKLTDGGAPYKLSLCTWGGNKLFLGECKLTPVFTLTHYQDKHPVR